MAQWECGICGYIYNEELGSPEHGIAPGTLWMDLPAEWRCPMCGVAKDQFTMIEMPPVVGLSISKAHDR
jgi:rubredoxin